MLSATACTARPLQEVRTGLLASAIGGVNYIDQAAQSGATYYHVVTAVDDQGRESAYSNQAVMTLP
jgi:hypothetical protein